jgi:hypothetical protein
MRDAGQRRQAQSRHHQQALAARPEDSRIHRPLR